MGRCTLLAGIVLGLGAARPTSAQLERTVILCDPADPGNLCPGTDCMCIEDTLEVTFDGDSQSVLYTEHLDIKDHFEATIVTDARTLGIQGWYYGIAHDPELLTLLDASFDGTDASQVFDGGFNLTTAEDIQTCGPDVKCGTSGRTDGGGWISAVVLSFVRPRDLPLGRKSVAKARYDASNLIGLRFTETYVEISDRLAREDAPPGLFGVTVRGRSRRWSTGVHGLVTTYPDEIPPEPDGEVTCDDAMDNDMDGLIDAEDPDCQGRFFRGDADGNGRIQISDAILIIGAVAGGLEPRFDCPRIRDADDNGVLNLTDGLPVLGYVFHLDGGPPLPAPFLSCGKDTTPDELTCNESNCTGSGAGP